MKKSLTNILGTLLAITAGAGIAFSGGQESVKLGNFPLFTLLIIAAYLVQWIAFIFAYLQKSERFFDLTGSLTYITLVTAAVLLIPQIDRRAVLLLVVVVIWATRLGTFLFGRVLKQGRDDRFDEIKLSFTSFLLTWTLQGLWVTFTAAAALAAITSTHPRELGRPALVGLLVWALGYFIEMAADVQKSAFRANPDNKDAFIRTGLWAWSRHPNYFGEIVLWLGVALIALSALRGWALLTLISPLWVIIQLTVISGVPMLERKADKKWGGQADYEAYKANTPVLIPRPPSRQ